MWHLVIVQYNIMFSKEKKNHILKNYTHTIINRLNHFFLHFKGKKSM